MTRSPGMHPHALLQSVFTERSTDVELGRIIDGMPCIDDGNAGSDSFRGRSNSQRVFSRQMMKSSMDVKQRVQEAIDTAKAAELALREMMGSWRAAK